MGKTLYLECASGISGDMTVGALLDLGGDAEVLNKVLESLPVTGFRTEITRVDKSSIGCTDFNVILEEDNHDHDEEYLYSSRHEEHFHHHNHDHEEEEEHSHHHHHEHEEPEEHIHHHHVHRHLSDVYAIIDGGTMTDGARVLAKKIFRVIAEAEAKAHRLPVEEVHFHEVGAVDSIVDIVAIAVLADNLQITDTVLDRVCEGHGTVRCQHGVLPVPVPAVANILETSGIPLHIMDREGEFVTPTGIAAAAALWSGRRLPKEFRVIRTGYGAGKRKYDGPGYLRAMIIEEKQAAETECAVKLETNVDDCTGEAMGYVMEKLMEAGAYDAHSVPVYMKKNRPGWLLNVICNEQNFREMEEIVFRETTTIGIRRTKMERTVLDRHLEEVTTEYGTAKVKVCETSGEKRYYPEYESVKALCEKSGVSFQQMFRTVMANAYSEGGKR